MAQQANEIQGGVVVPLAADSEEKGREAEKHTTSRRRHQHGASDIDACT